MSRDSKTLDFYDHAAEEYAEKFALEGPGKDMLEFMALLPAGGRVLDLGCGPGKSSAHLRDAGFEADAIDASAGMLEIARTRFGIHGTLATFEQLDAEDLYDGVWANFSLLHASRADMPAHFGRIYRALKPGGVLHLGLKLGENEKRDELGRFYTYFSEAELDTLLDAAGFTTIEKEFGHGKGMAGNEEPYIVIRARAGKDV